ncbi:carboxypeptidase regulatory-like domain-containing protein [candidate division KSB1 bacterium]|nr:carboxypeptidase regulatory-like domain-containing protein [candidate division KSB1 bacterium]
MKKLFFLFFVFWMALTLIAGHFRAEDSEQTKVRADNTVKSDSIYIQIFMSHLREHFDDLHDVIMRFHHQDPAIKGLITLDMLWQDNKLISCAVESNDTGSEALASGLIEKLKAWEIDGLDGPFTTVLPLCVRIVGSDEPDFPNLAILTGFAGDKSGNPVRNAVIVLRSLSDPEIKVPYARTNSEGIFIRTLIPPGKYQLLCVPVKGDTMSIGHLTFIKGEHKKEHVVIDN